MTDKQTPKRRFKEFENAPAWEQRKVESLFTITRGQVLAAHNTSTICNTENPYPVYSSQTKNKGLMGYYSEYLFEDAITWTTDGANAGTVNFREGKFFSTNVNGVLLDTAGYACLAVAEILNSVAYKYVSKVGNPKLMNNVMAEIPIMISKNIDELKKISDLIAKLDETITLHQCKLEKLQNLKKAYLQEMFPSGNENVPKRRFKGFTGPWEQRKLGDVTEFYDEKRVPLESSIRSRGEYPYYGATGIIDFVDDYIFDGEYVLLAEDGANIVMRTSPVAYITSGKFWLNNHAHIMKMIDGDNFFLLQQLERINYLQYNSGTAQPKLNAATVKNISLDVPSKKEQKVIGKLFQVLDKTITLHQCKLDKLKALKQAYLKEMFP